MGYSKASSSQRNRLPSEKSDGANMLSEQKMDCTSERSNIARAGGAPKKSASERSGVHFDNSEIMKPTLSHHVRSKRSKIVKNMNRKVGRPLLPPPTLPNSRIVPVNSNMTQIPQLLKPTILVTPLPVAPTLPVPSGLLSASSLPVGLSLPVALGNHFITEEIHEGGPYFGPNVQVDDSAFNAQRKRKSIETASLKCKRQCRHTTGKDKEEVRNLSEDEEAFFAAAVKLAKLDTESK